MTIRDLSHCCLQCSYVRSSLLEKVQVLQGRLRQRTPQPAAGQLVLEKEVRAWFSHIPGPRWQMLGETATAASATQFSAQLAGPWAPGPRGSGRAPEAGRMPSPQPCTPALCTSAVLSPLASVSPSSNSTEASSSLSFAPMPKTLARLRLEFWLQSPSLLEPQFPYL